MSILLLYTITYIQDMYFCLIYFKKKINKPKLLRFKLNFILYHGVIL